VPYSQHTVCLLINCSYCQNQSNPLLNVNIAIFIEKRCGLLQKFSIYVYKQLTMEKQPINTEDTKEIKTSEIKVENTVENTINNNESKDNTKCEYDDWFAE